MRTTPVTDYAVTQINVVLLNDEEGLVQAILPADRILDLSRLARLSGRQLEPVIGPELDKLHKRLGLKTSPLASIEQAVTYVDSSLQPADDYEVMQSGLRWEGKLTDKNFGAVMRKATAGNFSAMRYAPSTCADNDLTHINSAIARFTPLRISQRLEETLDLPPLPEVARRIIALRMIPDADGTELADILELDPGMSAQILSWARSPYYSSRGDVKTVEDAVNRVLGFDLVMNLSLGLALGRSLSVPKEGPYGYAPFWQQAILGATLAHDLVRKMPFGRRPSQGMAYLAGLLHNFGFLILGQIFPPQFTLINRHIEANPHINRVYIEHHLLGITREQCSACLMKQWDMPKELINAIRYQHDMCFKGEHADYSRLLYVTTRLLRSRGIGDGPDEEIPEEMYKALQLDPFDAADVVDALMERKDEFNDLIGMLQP
ncbi:MAG TPA: histidine kinase [Oceanospirillales bacterium]|mgnify:CR=1 FL=1|nr:histidine kinase [Oceanospirillaceae bacterium]HBS41254.1 histidine kinase [Oceanospirillales bacterium]|tara:strand:- start:2175 stop:3473 length:1299 start_codon:yes stop_codon:yes gene_type:complete